MEINRKKAGIVAAVVSSALLIGGGGLAFADTGTPSPTATKAASSISEKDDTGSVQEGDQGKGGDQGSEKGETTIAGTIKAPADTVPESEAADGSADEKAQDQAETAALAKLATVTEQQATKAATDLVPGTLGTVSLGDENGFVVWQVDITKADGTIVEVLVDAGNAGNLAQQTD